MLKIFIVSVALSASCFGAMAQAPFEGIIKFKSENKTLSEHSEADWTVKGGNGKLDIVSRGKDANVSLGLYFVQGESNIKLTSEGDKKVYNIPLSSLGKTEFSTAFSVESTGNKNSYAGFECEEFLVRSENSITSCWISKTTGIGVSSFPSILVAKGAFPILEKNGIKGIPLKITTKDLAGNVITDTEIISIQASAVPDNIFVIPAGYEKGN